MKRWLISCLVLVAPSVAWAETSTRGELDSLARTPEARPAADLIARARAAYARADRLRGTGDAIRAKLAESSAETWAQAARSLVEAERTRSKASALEAKAHEADERLSRARATLEASFARVQSLEAELAAKTNAKAEPSKPGKAAPNKAPAPSKGSKPR